MNYIVSFRPGGWAVALLLLSAPLYAQPVKENRNNYAKPLPKTEKLTLSVARVEPFIFSPHLSYKEQKQIQVAKKKVGGITFVVKSTRSGNNNANYKRPPMIQRPTLMGTDHFLADTSAPFIRYELKNASGIRNQ
ncbi:hypothetical protein [Runella slithyformis]|uniref:Uncharacterized protein n=1 Tax=Runella slithyformis (strain ATCC 29530 / DSM 19594 / LMG 11500 / NCIMB 11436 / LSU 4) TaxID=761193 RepID=A0A7U4E7V6_RUNSL|nr:hypothetical protein [Runella slithyformis]AEI50728.1 hypothetical protein Runsl_4399 [Runella slithyformis DSM 19594]